MEVSHKDLEHQVLGIVVDKSSREELQQISLNLHTELVRYCEIINELLEAKPLNNNGLLHPVSDLLACRKGCQHKWKLIQKILWQYAQISMAIDWICEHDLYQSIPLSSVEKLPDVLASFYQQKVPAVLAENSFGFYVDKYQQMSVIQIVQNLTMIRKNLSKRIHAFYCLHKRIMEKK